MYKYIFFILISALFTACSNSEKQAGDTNTTPPEESSPYLHFSKEQLDLAGVKLGQLEKRIIRSFISCTGNVDIPPQSLHSVHSPITGFIESVPFIVGNYVKQGRLLTRIFHPDFARLQGDFLEIGSQLSFLKNEYERLKQLSEKQAASIQSLQKAEAEWKAMQVHYQSQKAALELLGLDADKLEKSGTVQKYLPLFSPANGFLVEVNINPGKLVNADQLLFQIVDNSHMHLELQVFAKDAPLVQEGAPIRFRVPGTTDWHTGDVHLLGQMIEQNTKTTRVHGHFDNEPIHLLPGTYVQAEIAIPSDSVWSVPQSAIITEGNTNYIFKTDGNHFEKTEVQTGKSDENFVEILNFQLPENYSLVIKGAYYLNAGEEEPEHNH